MVLVIVLGALTAALCSSLLLDHFFGKNAGWFFAAIFGILFFILLSSSQPVLNQSEYIEFTRSWIEYLNLDFDLRLDGLGLLFALLVLGIGALVMAYSAMYLPAKKNSSFYALMTIFAIAMFGLVTSDNIILFFIFWEITTLCSFFLISRSGAKGHQPSIRTFILTGTGGLSLLTAVSISTVRTGSTKISEILISPVWENNKSLTATVAVLIIIAAFSKSAQFPFQAWLPDAMAAIMPVSAYLHAAAMVKAGIFLLMRFSPIFSTTPIWNTLLISIGLTTAIIGAIFAYQRDDIKELLAYSTVSQLGLIVATIGIGTKYAIFAASIHIIAHALFKSSLFMLAGVTEKQSGTRKLSELSGFASKAPWTATTLAISSMSMAGIIPLLGFVSKESILKAFLSTPGPSWVEPAVVIAVCFASIFTFAYSAKLVISLYKKPSENEEHDTQLLLLLAPLIASLLGLILGLYPKALDTLVNAAITSTLYVDASLHLSLWHGLTTEFYLSCAIVIFGMLLTFSNKYVSKTLNRKLFPVTGVQVLESIRTGLHYLGKQTTYLTKTDKPSRHLVVPLFLIIALGIVTYVYVDPIGPVINNADEVSDFFLLSLLVLPVLGLAVVKSRIASVVLLGSVGLIMMIFYFNLGAPDVGITQLLVELLIVVFMMFSLRRLPKNFHHTTKRRQLYSAVVAVATGTITAFGVYFFVGRRPLSSVSQYYIMNAKEETGGTNIVNTILVDFRALDTLGEMTVLTTAGLAIMALLISVRVLQTPRRSHHRHTPTAADSFLDNLLPIRFLSRALIGIIVLLSLYLMIRGHHEPGGGFIAALTTSVGIALVYLGTTHRDFIHSKGLPYIFLGSGIVVALATAISGYLDGYFLKPLHLDISVLGFHLHLSTSMLFDTGVYLAVIGVVLAAINRLSMDDPVLLREPRRPKLVTASIEEEEDE